ncbi:MAG: hypothetical protein HIU84_12905 [Acidobacteria bacterium]|nr:hypothetical protein [Acidobacteriota bacterium]
MGQATLHQRTSSFLQWIDELTSRVATALVVALIMVVFVVVLAEMGFPATWQVTFATFSNAIVIVMLFVLKHTEARQQTAIQIKLDELIRASPIADDHLVHIERAEENELAEREQQQIAVHESLRSEDEPLQRDDAK